jgi:hypothetical protein
MYRADSRRARVEIPYTTNSRVNTAAVDATQRLREESFRYACGYAANGWPVLPGSAWNGRHFVVSGTTKVTNGLRPTLPRNYASTNVDTISSWWTGYERLVPSVLITSGAAFQMIKTSIDLGGLAAQSEVFRTNAGPVLIRQDIGSMFFLVRPDARLSGGFNIGNKDIVVMQSGAYAAAPPTEAKGSRVSWLIRPGDIEWKPAHYDVIREALTVAVQRLEPTTKARPYVSRPQPSSKLAK